MDRNLNWKIVLIVGLVIVAVWSLYPPSATLKPGIDLAGGTSLIYEIDSQGMDQAEKRELSTKMITILRRRIDPANIQNLVWRPQGGTRFEIQMPLASADARQKRQDYEKTLSDLLEGNINPAIIMRSLKKPTQERTNDFERFTRNDPNKLTGLDKLAAVYDQYTELQKQSDELFSKLKPAEDKLTAAKLEVDKIKSNVTNWNKLDQQQLTKVLKDFPGSANNLDILTDYVNTYAQWTKVVEKLTDPDLGLKVQYRNERKALDQFNLTAEQVNRVLGMSANSAERTRSIEELKAEFPDRAEKIEKVVTAYDQYRPFRGELDDAKDLQRMLKGVGILEFRILPTTDRTDLSAEEIDTYQRAIKEKGPKYASDNNYLWCELENFKEWKNNTSVTAAFGEKYYVLTSNKQNEVMLRTADIKKSWKLKNSRPTSDQQGRRAISFELDERGGRIFSNLTGGNLERPLCILLDGIALSAPNIQARISTSGIITGSFTQTEVTDMVNKLNAGSLPARLIEQPISIKTIGPSIGANNRDKGIMSGVIALIVVVAFMAVYYTVGGAIANAALCLNVLFVLAIMATIRATFTLPGIAGMVLTIGMAIDANVLIFERVREEQQRGCSLRMAIKNGYERAFTVIFDSNLTTIITAAILYWVASEEIKGFAIVLMLGLAASMFTALFVTRTTFDFLLSKKIMKDHLIMLRIIGVPKINWMGLRPAFLTFSTVLVVAGLYVFFTRDNTKNNKYDIEFTGGTSAQINLKQGVSLSRQDVEDKIQKVGNSLGNRALAAANVYSIGKSDRQYEINTIETNKTKAEITFPQAGQTIDAVTAAIAAKAQESSGNKLNNLTVQAGTAPASFEVSTSNLNTSLVKTVLTAAFPDANVSEPQVDEVVNNAILAAFKNQLEIKQNLVPKIVSQEKITDQVVDSYPELADFLGGVKITCELERPAAGEELKRRFDDLRFKPDVQNLAWYAHKILTTSLAELPNEQVKSFVYISVHPEAAFRQLTEEEWSRFTESENTKVMTAGQLETSLPQVTQINPSVGGEAKTRALIAIILSFIAMVIYLWVRFGNIRYGIGAIISLMHDVCITLGVVCACTYITSTAIGQRMLIGDFKIDLTMIAAFLTLVGYSVNDTIVVFDRIRENRHKAGLTPQLINDSINQTLSRTILTSFATFLVVFVMYVFGGPSTSLRGFNFAMCFGIFIGTYSSIAIASPILLLGYKADKDTVK
jgi:SecD/SecF fusion protein